MKKLYLFLWLLLFPALSVMADSFTIEFTDTSGETSQSGTTVSNFFKSTSTQYIASVSTTTNVYTNNGNGIRLGTSNKTGTFTFTLASDYQVTPTKVIVSAAPYNVKDGGTLKLNNTVVFKVASGQTAQTFVDYEVNVTGKLTEISLTTSAKRACIKSITIEYGSSAPTTVVPAFTTQPEDNIYYVGQTADALTVVVTGTPTPALQWYSNTTNSNTGGTLITGATSASYIPSTAAAGDFYYYCVATNSAGTATSNVAYVGVTTFEAPGHGDGTAANPYDVTRAVALINNDMIPANQVHVAGTITSITDFSTQYGNATYLISDGVSTTPLTIYRGKNLNNTAFTTEGQIQVNDLVVVYGSLLKYVNNGTVTPEMASGNYLVSLTRPGTAPAAPVFNPDGGSVEVGSSVTITATGATTINYSVNGAAQPAVTGETATYTFASIGSFTISATATNDYGTTAAVEKTFTVVPAPTWTNVTANILMADQDMTTANSYGKDKTVTWVSNDGKYTFTTSAVLGSGYSGTNYPAWRTSDNKLRIYYSGRNIITVNAPNDCQFTKVTIGSGVYKINDTEMTEDGSNYSYTFDTPATSFTLSLKVTSNQDLAGLTVDMRTTRTVDPTPAAPTFNPASGTQVSPGSVVTITSAIGTTLQYSVNGADDITTTTNTATVTINGDTSIEAKALVTVDGTTYESETVVANYTLLPVGAPTFSLEAGRYKRYTHLTITAPSNATGLHYVMTTTSGHLTLADVTVEGTSVELELDHNCIITAYTIEGERTSEGATKAYTLYKTTSTGTSTETVAGWVRITSENADDKFGVYGGQYLILNRENFSDTNNDGISDLDHYAMSTDANTNNRPGVKIETMRYHEAVGQYILEDDLPANAMKVNFYANLDESTFDPDGTYMLNIEGTETYLAAPTTASNNLYIKGANALGGEGNATVSTFDNRGEVTITFQGTGRNVMQFNNSNKLFNCYASASQQSVNLYYYDPNITLTVAGEAEDLTPDAPEIIVVPDVKYVRDFSDDTEIFYKDNVSVYLDSWNDLDIHYTTNGTDYVTYDYTALTYDDTRKIDARTHVTIDGTPTTAQHATGVQLTKFEAPSGSNIAIYSPVTSAEHLVVEEQAYLLCAEDGHTMYAMNLNNEGNNQISGSESRQLEIDGTIYINGDEHHEHAELVLGAVYGEGGAIEAYYLWRKLEGKPYEYLQADGNTTDLRIAPLADPNDKTPALLTITVTEKTLAAAPSFAPALTIEGEDPAESALAFIDTTNGTKVNIGFNKNTGKFGTYESISASNYAPVRLYAGSRNTATGVNDITAPEAATDALSNGTRYFNLQGVQMRGDRLAPGIYIKVENDRATKVVVK